MLQWSCYAVHLLKCPLSYPDFLPRETLLKVIKALNVENPHCAHLNHAKCRGEI